MKSRAQMKHVVQFSSGDGSRTAAKRVTAKYGTEGIAKQVKGWVGVVDGRMDIFHTALCKTQYSRIYKTRKEAFILYEDVRRVIIKECK